MKALFREEDVFCDVPLGSDNDSAKSMKQCLHFDLESNRIKSISMINFLNFPSAMILRGLLLTSGCRELK